MRDFLKKLVGCWEEKDISKETGHHLKVGIDDVILTGLVTFVDNWLNL